MVRAKLEEVTRKLELVSLDDKIEEVQDLSNSKSAVKCRSSAETFVTQPEASSTVASVFLPHPAREHESTHDTESAHIDDNPQASDLSVSPSAEESDASYFCLMM